jgi:hypothetical protein
MIIFILVLVGQRSFSGSKRIGIVGQVNDHLRIIVEIDVAVIFSIFVYLGLSSESVS